MVSSAAETVVRCENPKDEDFQQFSQTCENALKNVGDMSDRSVIHILDRIAYVMLNFKHTVVSFCSFDHLQAALPFSPPVANKLAWTPVTYYVPQSTTGLFVLLEHSTLSNQENMRRLFRPDL